MKNYILIGIVLVLAVSLFQTFQLNAMKKELQGMKATQNVQQNVQLGQGGQIDMSGWTENEKMMYEHHGTLPARASGGQAPSDAMAGGC